MVRQRTRDGVSGLCVANVFSEDYSEAAARYNVNMRLGRLSVMYSRLEMEVNMTVKEPRAWVVGAEADRDIVRRLADADHVALRRVDVVVRRLAGTANDVEGVTVQMERMLMGNRML
jgi:hypothetical protein